MTHVYQWFSVPQELSVVCPRCASRALVRRRSSADYGQPLVGNLVCMNCHHNVEAHTVIWPNDAFYRCDVRGHELWAWSEDHARTIREFIDSKTRKARSPALLHLPEFFLRAKHREATVKALDRLLA
jgi:hypothetical protein